MVVFLKGLTDISCDVRENRQLLLCYEDEHLIADKWRPLGRRYEVAIGMSLIHRRFILALR